MDDDQSNCPPRLQIPHQKELGEVALKLLQGCFLVLRYGRGAGAGEGSLRMLVALPED